MTVDFAVRLASTAGRVLTPKGGSVLVGKDPRISGYMFEAALEAGFIAAGVDVKLLQVMPTPGIAFLTRALGADLGVVISASHNPYEDNGIKFFDRSGSKLSDELEARIEQALEEPVRTNSPRASAARSGATTPSTAITPSAARRFDANVSLTGLRIVVDCANGATYKVAPRVFSDLGADVISIGCSPNGRNINDECGSTAPAHLQRTVTALGAQLGIAFDGDGDRVVMVDERGQPRRWRRSALHHRHAAQGGRDAARAGRRHADEQPRTRARPAGRRASRSSASPSATATCSRGCTSARGVLGGETSGHVICLDRTTTGDGIISALQVLAAMHAQGASLHGAARRAGKVSAGDDQRRGSQALRSVRRGRRRAAVRDVESSLGARGRVVLRPSGTEPLIRVMVEGEDAGVVRAHAEQLAAVVTGAAPSV